MPAKGSLALVSFQKGMKGGQCKSADKYVHHSYIGWSTVTYWIFHLFLYSFMIREHMPVRAITPAWAKQLQKKKDGQGRTSGQDEKYSNTTWKGCSCCYFFFSFRPGQNWLFKCRFRLKILANGVLMLLRMIVVATWKYRSCKVLCSKCSFSPNEQCKGHITY